MDVTKEQWGETAEMNWVDLYTLTNDAGARARLMTYGATLVSLEVPGKGGVSGDVVLGCESLAGYLAGTPYFGSTVGRCANRIARGRFELNGRTYQLATNAGPNHLHGGMRGFDKVIWSAQSMQTEDEVSVRFIYRSVDGEEEYPGNLSVYVTYRLTNDNELRIDYRALTDEPTPVNLTNHTYWNLAGGGDVLGHEVTIHADRYTLVGEDLIPTGEIGSVAGTALDFRSAHRIGERADETGLGGYDHNYVVRHEEKVGEPSLALAGRVYEPTTGRVMEVLTTMPGMQFYTGNFLDGSVVGKGGHAYEKHAGFCLETQYYPDTPNNANFPSCILDPSETYEHSTVYRFSVG